MKYLSVPQTAERWGITDNAALDALFDADADVDA